MTKISLVALALLAGCASMSQTDMAAWIGQPVAELDTNTQLLTLPVKVTRGANDLEVRTYSASREFDDCDSRTLRKTTQTSCASTKLTCSWVFYVKGGKVADMTQVGHCLPQHVVKPQGRWQRL